MADNEKIPVSVYQLDLNRFDEDDFEQIIEKIVKEVKKDGINLIRENLTDQGFSPFQISVYSIFNNYHPRWLGFLEPILDKGSRLINCQNSVYSYISFIGLQGHIFIVAGGSGTSAIARYTTSNFGLEILVRLFEKDSKVIKAIQDRGLTGSILGQTKFYRGDQRFSDENQFGKIFQEVKADLNKQILTKIFGFAEDELRRKVSGCLAKTSFQINKSIDFDMLLILIEKFVKILKRPAKFALNKVFLISKRDPKNQELLNELREWLCDLLFTNHKKGTKPDIDFCHKEYDSYLTASCFRIPLNKDELIEFDDLFMLTDLIHKLRENEALLEETVEEFKHSVLLRSIYSYDDDGVELTKGSVLEHIHGEFSYKDNTYFLVDGEWYKILPSFIKDLNEECSLLLNDTWDDTLITETFDVSKKECVFNMKFLDQEGCLVFDTVTPDNIEACDILKFDDNNVHVIHVKKGFDNSIRDLASQINIAAKRIREDLRSGFKYLEDVELRAKSGRTSKKPDLKHIGNQKFPHGGISTIFKTKKPSNIFFCLAFVDDSERPRSLKSELSKYKSNIAKFSLLELHRQIISMGFGFKVIQIKQQ